MSFYDHWICAHLRFHRGPKTMTMATKTMTMATETMTMAKAQRQNFILENTETERSRRSQIKQPLHT